jgi:DNA-binding ferritin-like protein
MYQDVLAHLRALQWSYTTTHWISAGPNAYGDHLLLERLYKGLAKPIDGLGERMVAYFGSQSVAPVLINDKAGKLIQWAGDDAPGRKTIEDTSLAVLLYLEDGLRQSIKTAWKANQDSGDEMSLGIDDFLMSLANERDEAVYLLKQRLSAGNR